jgi:hypothetical protein
MRASANRHGAAQSQAISAAAPAYLLHVVSSVVIVKRTTSTRDAVWVWWGRRAVNARRNELQCERLIPQ